MIVDARFTAKLRESGSCLIWTGYKDRDGYGRVARNGRVRPAHRLAYESEAGPIPEGMEVSQRCGNRTCVNPEHLQVAPPRYGEQGRVDRHARRQANRKARAQVAKAFRANLSSMDRQQLVLAAKAELLPRILAKTVVGEQSDCWLWQGAMDSNGYGTLSFGGQLRMVAISAHRASYILRLGLIPEGLTLDHLCRVTTCINPAHLEPVTASENSRRARAAGR